MHHHKTQVHTQLSCDSNPHGVKKKVRLGKKTKNKPWMPNHICYHVLGTSHLSYPHLPTCQVPPAVSHATSHMQSAGTLIWRCQWCSLVSELKLWSEEQHPTAKGRFKGEVKLKARNLMSPLPPTQGGKGTALTPRLLNLTPRSRLG